MSADLWIFILAGGSGTRFWPASRQAKPKQLLPVLGKRALLRKSVDRVLDLVPPERVCIISGQNHGPEVRRLLPDLPEENIILEPVGRNTAAACGLGAWWLKRKAGSGVMAVLPADHLIDDEDAFRTDLAAAAQAAAGTDRLITFGLHPTRPETGYGYLELGAEIDHYSDRCLHQLSCFKEKPDRATATEYLADDHHYWNAGMFVWEADSLLNWIDKLMPDLAAGLAKLGPDLLTERQALAMAEQYPDLERKSIDFGIMERAEGKCMFTAHWGWSDVGSWEAVYELSAKDTAGNALLSEAISVDSSNNLVDANGKMVALLGVKDLVVVDTGDAMLIMNRRRSQDVGRVIDALKSVDREDLI